MPTAGSVDNCSELRSLSLLTDFCQNTNEDLNEYSLPNSNYEVSRGNPTRAWMQSLFDKYVANTRFELRNYLRTPSARLRPSCEKSEAADSSLTMRQGYSLARSTSLGRDF